VKIHARLATRVPSLGDDLLDVLALELLQQRLGGVVIGINAHCNAVMMTANSEKRATRENGNEGRLGRPNDGAPDASDAPLSHLLLFNAKRAKKHANDAGWQRKAAAAAPQAIHSRRGPVGPRQRPCALARSTRLPGELQVHYWKQHVPDPKILAMSSADGLSFPPSLASK
jgi:hypothetical protein